MITVTNICKKYGRKVILDNISFEAKPGECIGIVGTNGCGKSTLLSILAGSNKADSGSLSYYGRDPLKNSKVFFETVGYVPQENPLIEQLSVRDNLRFHYCDTKADINNPPFGLKNYLNYTVSKLSGGLKKRLSIACTIAKEPQVLILDEPGAALDIICKEDIRKYLRTFLDNKGIVIIASHEYEELALCDKMYIIKGTHLTELPDKPLGPALIERMNECNE